MVKKLTDLPYVVERTARKKTKKGVKTYKYYYYERAGDRIALPDPFKNEDDFLAAYSDAKTGRAQRPVLRTHTYKALIEHYKTNSKTPVGKKRHKGWKDLAPRTRKDYDKCFEYIARNAGGSDFRKTRRMDIVAAMDANDHRKKFANDLKSCFSIIHNHAINKGWMATNPAAGISTVHTGEGFQAWPLDVQRKIWNTAYDFGEFGYFTQLAMILYIDSAQRGGDILDYKWSDLEDDGINIVQNKTSTVVFAPLTDWMRSALEVERQRQLSLKIVALPPEDYILLGLSGKQLRYNAMNDRFVKIRKAAGVDKKYTLHGLRYTGASELGVAAGYDGMGVTGHLTEAMFKQYAGDPMRKAAAIRAQKERNKNRPERESLKPFLKP